jgi:hypothetical protein
MRDQFKYLVLIVLFLSGQMPLAMAKEKTASNRLTTEQLLNSVRSIKHPSFHSAASDSSHRDVKCGFSTQAQVISRWQEFSQAQQAELSALMKADVMQCDTIAGHFHIFYDTTGINEPALLDNNNQRISGSAKAYIHAVAQIFNHVWDIEVDQMGYTAPPFESGQSYYTIDVENIDDYGDTWKILPQINGTDIPPRYYSYITVDNDYQQFATRGINGLKVTAAHEFHHAIQIGSYGYWDNDVYAYELTATWFEDVVYTEVNDYYNYLWNYFGGFSSGLSFNSSSYGGYERCIFAHYLAKVNTPDIMRDIWTGMRTQPFLESTDAALVNRGSTLQSAFAEFTKWNYYTWDRADTIHYYPEGNHYPRFQPLQKIDFFNTTSTTTGDVEPLSSSMYEYDLSNDTITAVIANVDMNNALLRNTIPQNITVTLSSGLTTSISVDTPSSWRSFFIQSSTRTSIARQGLSPAPNPFRLAVAPWLKLPINQDAAKSAQVFFFTSSFKLVYSGYLNVGNEDGFRSIVVPTSEVKSKLSSGIYFILAKTVNSDYRWKVAVIQ